MIYEKKKVGGGGYKKEKAEGKIIVIKIRR